MSTNVLIGLDIDSENRYVISGYDCVPGCFEYVTIWHEHWGNIVHHKAYNSGDGLRSFCMAMTLDRADNVYLTGSARAGTNDGIVVTEDSNSYLRC
ncbi:MAG: hypothetical protein H6Q30_1593 [Bacteroidetes bacterium]|nr:hypothetical protein [Bacteroidota bacterium]